MTSTLHKIPVFLLIVALLLQLSPIYAADVPGTDISPRTGMSAFELDEFPTESPFLDIVPSDYYYNGAVFLQHLGLVKGRSETIFAPADYLSAAECATLAVRIYEMYHGLNTDFTPPAGAPWYSLYVEKALEYGILKENTLPMDEALSRADALAMAYYTLPVEELPSVRTVTRIPDLLPASPWYEEIITLYNAGIVSGCDSYGTLLGANPVTRGEFVTLISRLITPAERKTEEIDVMTGMAVFSAPELSMTHNFTDIFEQDWFYESAVIMNNLGLVVGRSQTEFAPSVSITLAEVTTLCVRVYELYHGITNPYTATDTWYSEYVSRAVNYNILPQAWTHYTTPATREEIAYLIYHTLPSHELTSINTVETFKDIDTLTYPQEVLALYKAGILNGRDKYGTFDGSANITRAEVVAMLTRLILPEKRLSVSLTPWPEAKIVIIAGHGMKNDGNLDPGSIATVNGIHYLEYIETRILSKYVVEALSEYAEVIYYPEDRDSFSDVYSGQLSKQVDFSDVDYALVIHFNYYNGYINGSLSMVTPSKKDTSVEQQILASVSSLGFKNKGVYNNYLVVTSALTNLGVNNSLLEVCFLDNASDMRLYESDKKAVGIAIATGLAKGLGLTS